MKKYLYFLIITSILVCASACSKNNSIGTEDDVSFATTSADGVTDTFRSEPGFHLSINEVGVGTSGYVSLTNFTSVPVNLAGLYLCQGNDCFELPDVVVDPESTIRIAVGNGQGLENVVATYATIGELRPADGEIALFNSDDFKNPQEIAEYFQWGAPSHLLTQMAIDAGQWVEGGYGPSGENATRLFRDEETGLWLWEWE